MNDLPEGRKKYCSKKCVNRAWYLAHQEEQKNKARAWRKANPEQVKSNKRIWHATNRDRDNATHAAWNKIHRKHINERAKKWRILTAERRKAQHESHMQVVYSKLQVLFGLSCFDCAKSYPMAIYHYHHLNPTEKEGRLHLSKWTWPRIESYVTNTVQLCPNCHALRHYTERAEEKTNV
jgi:hypothetical protein